MSINSSTCFLPQQQAQNRLYSDNKRVVKKAVSVTKQREMIEQLQKIVIESDQQNKRLHQQIFKMSQRQKNAALYYQSKILQLQNTIEKQMLKIETLQTQKLKRQQVLYQSKLIRSNLKESKKYTTQQQKQNINTLNSNFQHHSQEENYSKEQIKKYLSQLCQKLDYLLHSMQIRKLQSENEQYIRQLQIERQKKKCLAGKDSLLLLKNIHQKMVVLQNTMSNISTQFYINGPLLISFKNIKKMQQRLLKIPFLEKINVNERKQELDDILQQAKQTKKRLLFTISKQNKQQ